MASTQEDKNHRERLVKMITVPDLSEPDKTLLCDFLLDHNDVFPLDETD